MGLVLFSLYSSFFFKKYEIEYKDYTTAKQRHFLCVLDTCKNDVIESIKLLHYLIFGNGTIFLRFLHGINLQKRYCDEISVRRNVQKRFLNQDDCALL